jgi:putative membrane protein
MGAWGGWGGGWGGMAFGHLLWWVLIAVGIVALLRWTFGHGPHRRAPAPKDSALAVLRERYARGEIDRDEFEDRRRVLGG